MRAENQLPKNIRQIGGPVGTTKVYIEDFVVTFLKALTTDKNTFVRGAILFGEKKSIDNETVIFIRGAVEGQNIELDLDETVFDDKVWREIYQKKERFFPDLEVIGWALSRMGFSVRLNDKIKKTHFENFPGDGKVLYMTDHLEGEDAFYVYRGQDLVRQSGYYIYYEKNPMMQEYLIERNQKLKEAVSYETMLEAKRDEKIVRQFRTIVQEKQKSSKTKDMMKRLSSSAAMLLVLILAGGMFYYSRLDNSSSFGDAIHGAVETMGKGVKDNVSMEEENKGSGTTTKKRTGQRRARQRTRKKQKPAQPQPLRQHRNLRSPWHTAKLMSSKKGTVWYPFPAECMEPENICIKYWMQIRLGRRSISIPDRN